jgi:hypothetical protein
MSSDGSNSLHLVGTDGDSKSSSTDEESSIRFTSDNLLGRIDGSVGVGCKEADGSAILPVRTQRGSPHQSCQ